MFQDFVTKEDAISQWPAKEKKEKKRRRRKDLAVKTGNQKQAFLHQGRKEGERGKEGGRIRSMRRQG